MRSFVVVWLVAAGERKEKRERSEERTNQKKKEGEMREIFLNFKPCHVVSHHIAPTQEYISRVCVKWFPPR
jgi:hypothetical protein